MLVPLAATDLCKPLRRLFARGDSWAVASQIRLYMSRERLPRPLVFIGLKPIGRNRVEQARWNLVLVQILGDTRRATLVVVDRVKRAFPVVACAKRN